MTAPPDSLPLAEAYFDARNARDPHGRSSTGDWRANQVRPGSLVNSGQSAVPLISPRPPSKESADAQREQ